MDGQPRTEDHRRGGSRGGGLGRKNSGRGYRHAQTSTGDSTMKDAKNGDAASNGSADNRKVELVEGGKSAASFPSSLQESLRQNARVKTGRKRGERAGNGRGGHSREQPKSVRERSPAPHKGDLQLETGGTPKPRSREVISLSSPSPPKESGQTKISSSSLKQSIERNSHAPKFQDREAERGGRGGRSGGLHQGGSLRHSQGRNGRHLPNEEQRPSYRKVERGASGSRDSRSRSSSRPKLSRKGSSDSISSQTSVRSERNHRRERGPRGSSPAHGGGGLRSSLTGGDPRDKTGEPRELRRLSSDSSFKSSRTPSVATTVSSQDVRMSTQDVRVQKPRPSSSRMDRGAHAPLGRVAQDSSNRRSSLDGNGVALRRFPNRSTTQDARLSAQDARSSLEPTPPDVARPSPVSVSGGLRKNAPITASARTPPPPSSLNSPGTQEKEDKSLKTPPPPSVDDAKRKRLAETLKERMDARKLGGAGSLAQMMKAPLNRQGSPENASPQGDTRLSPFGAGKELENGGVSSAAADKEARTKAYYSKLDKENKDREAARRAVSLNSSLSASLASTRSQPKLLNSSLAAALQPMRTIPTRAQKIVYSLAELRGLIAFAVPRPSDLMDMKIVEVIQVRDPQSVVPRRSAARVGRGAGYGNGRAAGGGGIRKSDRFGSGGSRGPLPRHQGNQGGRRDRNGGRGGRGGGRGGRGGGRGYGAPSPPLYDGPIEPLKITENGWKAQKEKKVSPLETMLNHVKSLLNKLTREKFAKLTKELCSIDINSMTLLRSIVSIIMDKAMEEANFADVYADLCKEYHVRTHKKIWSFVHVLEDDKGAFYWAALDQTAYEAFAGPFESVKSCLKDATAAESTATSTCEHDSLPSVNFHYQGDYVLAVGEKEKGAFYYSKRKISELTDNEAIEGPFLSAELAQQSAASQTTFSRLLVTRCQLEFEKTIKHTGSSKDDKEEEEEEVDSRRREILAMRAKAKMLGNIRFIGELFKVDMIKLNVVQGCIFYLLGLELITDEKGHDVQAQAVRLPENEDLEALCKMLATVGKKLDQPKTKMIMKIIILRMVELSDNKSLPSRPRFLLKDVLEMRDHMWEPRRKEMQQKTLNEIRREAQKLQQQGKNAQHDDLTRRRHKTQITSAQLAKQSSNLIVEKVAEPEQPDEPAEKELSPAQMSSRIKNTIQEYISIVDLDEAATCVQELPVEPYHVEFAEQTINTALESKTGEREHAVDLLVGLYERGVLNANSIQAALVNVMEFLEDMRIDLPLVHQYSALIFGRLVAAGCFGLSWIVSEALAHLVECKLTSQVFPEVLNVLEEESDESTVVRMLADEEIAPESVLPAAMRSNEAEVQSYLRENGIKEFFDGEDEDELDPEVAGKMRNTLEEYLSVKDFDEVVRCVTELEDVADRWRHFVHTLLLFSLEAKKAARADAADLLLQLFTNEHITSEDVETAVEPVLEDYDDLRVDIPQLATNLGELWTPLFEKQALSPTWLADACADLVASGRAADVFVALFTQFEMRHSQEKLVAWWKTQSEPSNIWTQLTPTELDSDVKQYVDSKLAKWKDLLQ